MQYKILLIELDITYVNKAAIFFKNGIPLSFIGTIEIDTLVGITNFYVVDTSTLFFLYLKKIDILDIYLNNIIN